MTTDNLGKILHQLDHQLGKVENALNFIGGSLVFALMFLGVTQIFLRTAFRQPIFGYIDIVEVSMVGFAILSIGYVQRLGGHVRMELVVSKLKGRALWIAEWLSTAIAIFIITVLIPYSYNHFDRAISFGDSTIDIELPTWPAKLIVPIALSLLLLRLIIQLAGYWRLIVDPEREPIAVPTIKDVEEQAEEEIVHAEEDILHEHLTDEELNISHDGEDR